MVTNIPIAKTLSHCSLAPLRWNGFSIISLFNSISTFVSTEATFILTRASPERLFGKTQNWKTEPISILTRACWVWLFGKTYGFVNWSNLYTHLCDFLVKRKIGKPKQPLYSPEPAQANFWQNARSVNWSNLYTHQSLLSVTFWQSISLGNWTNNYTP